MTKRAVCIGINNYPGLNNDLNGCVNDMNDWADLLRYQYNFDVSTLADGEATAEAILSALAHLVDGATNGDCIVVTCSSHGSYILDGVDADESDNYDEAICANDRNIIDDEIRDIINRIQSGVKLTVIGDFCHSGTATRHMLNRARTEQAPVHSEYPTLARYMPMENHRKFDTMMVPARHRSFGSDADMNHLLLTGCSAVEYSYDAWINNRFNGAMSANAIAIIRENPAITYSELNTSLRKVLPSRHYPQTPQLEGPDSMRNRVVFS